MGLRLETNSLEQNERKREGGGREREREKGRECDSWIVVCGIALKSVVRECERQTAWNETAKKEAARFFSWKTGTRQSERERERPNLGIISGLARDKPGQHRPNEVKPRVNGALRFDSSFSTRNWLLPKITHNIVVTMIEYFYISVVFPICLSLSHPFLLLSSLVRKPFALRIFFSFFFSTYPNHAYPNHVYGSIDRSIFSKREVVARTQANENFIFRPFPLWLEFKVLCFLSFSTVAKIFEFISKMRKPLVRSKENTLTSLYDFFDYGYFFF